MSSRPARRRLARRLLTAQALVIIAGTVTLAVVALLVTPPLLQTHLRRALGPVSDSVALHLDQAVAGALLISLGIAVAGAVATALTISWILASRIARPIEQLSDAADRLARGDLTARGPRPTSGDELADLAVAFNGMADALEHTEHTRRRLLADVTHELRTPLSTLEGYLEALADGVVHPGPDTWSIMGDATSRLRRLVDDVGLASRAAEGQVEIERVATSVASLIEHAVEATAEAFRAAAITVTTDVATDLPVVEADRQQMAQVLENILRNACQHTPAGGEVRVEARRDGDVVTLHVRDTGEGIAPEHLPHVFERFYRGDAARSHPTGSGLGLTIARAITRAHGGDISASSAGPARGATFTVSLPAVSTETSSRR